MIVYFVCKRLQSCDDVLEWRPTSLAYYLVEVVEGFVQVGMHAGGRFIGDLDRVLQNALWDDVALRR